MNESAEKDAVANPPANARYLSFSLGSEEYALPLLSVKEVIGVPTITPLPNSLPHFLGIMNLRGQVISVIDLRLKLGIKPSQAPGKSIVICDLGSMCLGVVVDSINSVLAPQASEVSAKPEIQGGRNSDYITGVYRKENKLVLFLDIAKTLNVEDRLAISQPKALKESA